MACNYIILFPKLHPEDCPQLLSLPSICPLNSHHIIWPLLNKPKVRTWNAIGLFPIAFACFVVHFFYSKFSSFTHLFVFSHLYQSNLAIPNLHPLQTS